MKKRIFLIAGIVLLLFFYSGCSGPETAAVDDSSDDNSTVDYSKDSGFQELFSETKSGFEETFGDNQVCDMIYENGCIEIRFTMDGLATILINHYDDEKWNDIKAELNEISNDVVSNFEENGYDVDVAILLLNDENTEETLYCAGNGVGLYDYFGN